jgi:hypothetical protein
METKKIILSLLLLGIVPLKPAFGNPQDSVPVSEGHYLPTLSDSSTWYIVHYFELFGNYAYRTGDSILIDSICYREILGSTITELLLLCYLREDTAEKKIYMLTKDKKEEHLLYDFSLSESDTISLYGIERVGSSYFVPFGVLTVEKTDSVITLDGVKRKRIELSGGFGFLGKDIWIEGIGSIGNFMSPGGGVNMYESGELTCFYKNDQKVYYSEFAQSWGDGDCVIVMDIETLGGNKLKLFPNPFTDHLNIESESPGSFEVTVANMPGQVVYANSFRHTDNLQLDLSHLKSGLYRVVVSNGREVSGQTVVKHGE